MTVANEMKNANALPRATHKGVLKLGGSALECYVLSDGRRVLSAADAATVAGAGLPSTFVFLRPDGSAEEGVVTSALVETWRAALREWKATRSPTADQERRMQLSVQCILEASAGVLR